jgi:ABC-type dipeptide/oligopeptide/nickel transport system permease component
MREGSRTDRVLSTFSIATTATPEYVSGVILIAIFASATAGISPWLAEMAGSTARRCSRAPPPARWTTSPSGTSPCR